MDYMVSWKNIGIEIEGGVFKLISAVQIEFNG
jgi:hypothetical protein